MVNIDKLTQIAEIEFSDIVEYVIPGLNKMRIILKDGSFIDIWYSLTNLGRYAYHWERKNIDGTIYRHNNAPHKDWMKVSTFPKHFHNRTEENVESSTLSDDPEKALRSFLNFGNDIIKKEKRRRW